MSKIRLAQIINIVNPFIPTKVSLYLKRDGSNMYDYFSIGSGQTVIDATNFSKIEQSTHKLIFGDSVSGYTGNGYMEVKSFVVGVDAEDYPVLTFPIKSTQSEKFYVYLRSKSNSGNFKASIFLDENIVDSVNYTGVGTDWQWFEAVFVTGDAKQHEMNIRIEETDIFFDKMIISDSVVTDFSSNYSLSPFVTLHLQLYTTADFKPLNALDIYDYKNTIKEIIADDWYNFSVRAIHPSVVLSFDGSYAIVLSATGGTKGNYVSWDIVDSDEYMAEPSAIKYSND